VSERIPTVVVVGGGVAGLTAAYHIDLAGMGVAVLEADSRPGGKLRSVRVGGLEVEAGADSFVARKPWAVDLCRELGIGEDLSGPAASEAYLWTERGLVPFPEHAAFGIPGDVGQVLRWPGLSRAGRWRAAQDLVRRSRRARGDESLGALLRRRLGDEATDLAVAPLLAGLHAGDVDKLSVLATFPELAEWERRQGSLIRGSQAARRRAAEVAAGPMFVKPAGGVGRLPEALADTIGRDRVILDDPATSIERRDGRFVVRSASGSLVGDAVVLATPAFEAARLVRSFAQEAADELTAIPYASTAVVFLVYPHGTQAGLPDGTGFVVPRGKAPMTASTWLSSKWPRAEFGERAVVRCYVGGVGADELVHADEDDLIQACERHLAALVELPAHAETGGVVRWRRAMPQYEVGHLERVERIGELLPAGVFVTGAAYHGVGIPDCVHGASATAASVRDYLLGADRQEETAR
jgi:protoporphyrinogen/coproporphyrinogen III oxidase